MSQQEQIWQLQRDVERLEETVKVMLDVMEARETREQEIIGRPWSRLQVFCKMTDKELSH